MAEETKFHEDTQSDDEIIFEFDEHNINFQPQSEPSDLLYGTDTEESAVTERIKSILQEIRNKDTTNTTLLYKKENRNHSPSGRTKIDTAAMALPLFPSVTTLNGTSLIIHFLH